ncbi:polyprotein [Gossypium australe]|uniref:Polyprotein n=1 Tax=Gossypium australe TaxID=47621 RepID=A0A5B6VNM9_9ROSI|nr:polyprotein [Gossypium australe]
MSQKDLNLQQRRWLKLLKDYEFVIDYHPGKANVVADALSQKSLFALRAMNIQLMICYDRSILAELKAKPIFLQQICEVQKDDSEFQQVKAEHQVPSGLLQPVMIPEWKWDKITMDFESGLPLTPKKKDAIWVIVDRLTKSTQFIPRSEIYVAILEETTRSSGNKVEF